MNGNGCDGSTASGVRTGENLLLEPGVERLPVGGFEFVVGDEFDALGGEFRDQHIAEEFVDPAVQAGDDLPDRGELLTRVQAVGTGTRDAAVGLFEQTGDPDLMELVEVGGHDRNELDPLEEGTIGCERESEDAFLKRKEGQFTVEVRGAVGYVHVSGLWGVPPCYR